jgi:prepilin-type N-terminal cleavage/methylation domain-containing protein
VEAVKIAKTKGFSLIELLIVIAIMGITAAMGSFAWQRYYNNSNLRLVARQVMTDITNTKARAVAKMDTTYTMTFTADSYTINGTAVTNKALGDIGPGIKFDPVSADLTFLTRGTIDPSPGTITLTNSRGSKAEITYNQTGKTYVKFTMQ